jgi:hypothetical protein
MHDCASATEEQLSGMNELLDDPQSTPVRSLQELTQYSYQLPSPNPIRPTRSCQAHGEHAIFSFSAQPYEHKISFGEDITHHAYLMAFLRMTRLIDTWRIDPKVSPEIWRPYNLSVESD